MSAPPSAVAPASQASAESPQNDASTDLQGPPSTGRSTKQTLLGLQPPTPEQRAQALADIAAAEAAQAQAQAQAAQAPTEAIEVKVEAPPPPPPPPDPIPQHAPNQAISAGTPRKGTLVGMAPDAMLRPSAPRPAAATTQQGFSPPIKVEGTTQHGFAPPEAVRPEPRPTEVVAPEVPPARDVAASADAPTPIEVPISGAESWRGRASADPNQPPPTGVAKAYHGKVESAPVVVDAAVMQASEAAAQAAQAQARALRAGRRNINAVTIPGTVRVIPRGAGATPDIEPIDMAGLKPSRAPWLIGGLVLLLAGGAAAFILRGSPHPPRPPAAAAEKPPAEAPAPPPSAEPVAAAAPTSDPAPVQAVPEPSTAATANEPTAEHAPEKTSATRHPATTQKPAAPIKKTPAQAPKRGATSTGASPAKAKGVIVRDSPF